MRERIRFMYVYFLFWTVYFIIARIIFLSYHIKTSKSLTLDTVYGIFSNGIRMDLSMAAYLCILPFIVVTFSNFLKNGTFQNTIFTYTFTAITIVTLIIVIDLEVYNIWTFRLDATPLTYLKSPKEAWASVANSPVFQLILSSLILIALASNTVYRIVANKVYDWNTIKNFPFVIYGALITLALIIPIRGGIRNIAPMNHSSVYFSSNNFANISALNAPWNFFSSVFHNNANKVNPYTYLPKNSIDAINAKLYASGGNIPAVLNKKTAKPNVIFIVWESFSSKNLGLRHKNVEVTPYMNALKSNSLYFSNIYASGDRTDKAIPAILSAYPSQPTESIIKDPQKTAALPYISKDFNAKDYSTSFYYGGDTEFANIKSYLFNANFEKMVDYNDFPEELNNSKWGVHDEYLLNKFLDDNSAVHKKSFFSTILTLTSHEPFETNRKTEIEGDETVDQYLNSIHYTDQVLGEFLEKAKKTSWWDNTIIVILGDHGHRLPINAYRQSDFKIPVFWTGGAVAVKQNITKLGSQIDLINTLLGQLGWKNKNYPFGKNILDTQVKPWALFSFNNGFGFLKDTDYVIYDNVGRKIMNANVKEKSTTLTEGKALQQYYFQDFLNR
jgi:phosphoglycerol transferase MdoB-like AlkP superfamily enzyme